jgi:hypothetical protein
VIENLSSKYVSPEFKPKYYHQKKKKMPALPSNHKAPSSNSDTAKRNKRRGDESLI